MYSVEDETFQRARSILSSLARELAGQKESGIQRPVDLQELVRRSAPVDLPEGGEADYLYSIADRLERMYPISELFPRKRRDDHAWPVPGAADPEPAPAASGLPRLAGW